VNARFEVFPLAHPAFPQNEDVIPPGVAFFWHFKDANGHITFTGGESFTRREDAHRSIYGAITDTVSLVFGSRVSVDFHAADLAALVVDLDENDKVIVQPRGEEACRPVSLGESIADDLSRVDEAKS
jgi:hypothetical protein